MKVLVKGALVAALALVVSAQVAIAQVSSSDVSPETYGFSSEAEMNNYLSVSDVVVTESDVVLDAATEAQFLANPTTLANDALIKSGQDAIGSLGAVVLNPYDVNAWVALGKKAWEIVVKNQPVANVSTQRVSVLPAAQTNWAQMSNWKAPVARSYTISAKNGYGMETVRHTYTVVYSYGGQFNGAGSFLANATIIPTDVQVAWGFNLNSGVEVGQILNTGSVASPVPGVDLQLKWKMKTLLKLAEGTDSFFVRGNGQLTHSTK